MSFELVKKLKEKGLSLEDGDALKGMQALESVFKDYFDSNKNLTEDQITEFIQKALDDAKPELSKLKFQDKGLDTIIKDLYDEMEVLKKADGGNAKNKKTAGEIFEAEIKSREEDWQGLLKKKAPFEGVIKDAATNTRTSVPTSASNFLPEQELLPGYIAYRTNTPLMLQYASVLRTDKAVVNWVDETAGEGDAGWTAEGATKPLTDVNATVRNTTVVKVAAVAKVSEEALADISFLRSMIEGRMRNKLALKIDDGLLNGDGTSETPTGLAYYAPGFTSTEMNDTVESPNYFDALSAAATQIRRANFEPNIVFINPVDWFKMMHTKDADKGYVLLQLSMQNGEFLQMRAVKSNQVAVGQFIMGDMTYFNVAIREDVRFEVGWENDDFRKNLRTMIVEARLCAWVSENEKLAFVIDEYQDIIDVIDAAV